MQVFARIHAGLVAELIEADDAAALAERFHPDLVATMVPMDPGAGIGWRWDGTAFAAPLPPALPPPIRRISALAFRRRLSPARRAAVTLAASAAMEAGDATLQTWLDDLSAAVLVDLDGAETQAGLAAALAAGVITEVERAAMLADGTAAEAA